MRTLTKEQVAMMRDAHDITKKACEVLRENGAGDLANKLIFRHGNLTGIIIAGYEFPKEESKDD